VPQATTVSLQQKTLFVQLGIAHEGQVIDDDALKAYINLFSKPNLFLMIDHTDYLQRYIWK
jgi:hypothetical protein